MESVCFTLCSAIFAIVLKSIPFDTSIGVDYEVANLLWLY
ncbi:hypothetical protein CNEO_830010 [Clostridium neonatale]|nr:hypothetical protein CNEO_830010 [Clostridium neonatale]